VSVVFSKPPWESVPLPAALPYRVIWAALPALRTRSGAPLRPLTAVTVAREVRRLLADDPELVVHGNGEEAALVPSLRADDDKFGFVMTPRYPWLPGAPSPLGSRPGLLRRALPLALQPKYWLLGRALRGADKICPTSAYAARLVESCYGLPASEMSVIPNGVSDEFIAPALAAVGGSFDPPDLRVHAVPELSLEAGPLGALAGREFALYFGRIAREKGVDTILQALALTEHPHQFVFAGRGPALAALQASARRLGLERRVEFLTWLDAPQLAALVRQASFAVLPSLEESFGNTMAEAMALGVPVISTTAGSIPELIEHEQSGLLIEPGDAPALARAMNRLSADAQLRRALGAAGRARAQARYSWSATASSFERIYQAALQIRRSPGT
jgi:glycosyltransferase involved in cell wall biosynthesis